MRLARQATVHRRETRDFPPASLATAARSHLDETSSLLVELARSNRRLIQSAHDLMLARDIADLLDRGAESAVGEASRARGEEAIDHAVSSVRAASEARVTEIQALQSWVANLDRVDDLISAATRLTGRRI